METNGERRQLQGVYMLLGHATDHPRRLIQTCFPSSRNCEKGGGGLGSFFAWKTNLVCTAVVLSISVKLLKPRKNKTKYCNRKKLLLIFRSAKFEIGHTDPGRGKEI